MVLRAIEKLFKHEAAGGVALMVSAALALIVANTGLSGGYNAFLDSVLTIKVNGNGLEKPLILWINDGLMAIFFFLIGLELKYEMVEGRLRNPRDVILPGAAAAGGMALPAIVYATINWGNPETISGWAIPAATDIAFALGILALVGSRAPIALKVFLLTLAILDDLGAILVIALFYTADLKVNYLLMALAPLAALIWLHGRRSHRVAPALMLGVVMWVLVLKSGVHATLAGVVTAFLIPIHDKKGGSPLHALERGLGPYVSFVIVPLFAFANAGVVLDGMSLADLLKPVPMGIALGLILGKQVGVFATTWAIVKLGAARLPEGVTWMQIYGVACLAGIGFTMSLFIGGLSFGDPALMNDVRVGVLTGSIVSAVIGFVVLSRAGSPVRKATTEGAADDPAGAA